MRAPTVIAGSVIALVGLGPAAAARAQDDVPTPTIALGLQHVAGVSDPITAKGTRMVIRGVVRPYRPHQQVTVRVYDGDAKIYVKAMAVRRPKGQTYGVFKLGYVPTRAGRLRVQASHRATDVLGTGVANAKHVTVVTPAATAGQRGPAVRLLQRLL
ncbi:MAG TPA: hypothetical protein VHB30_03660, partial [Solirubrobacteraceae bacterium]|nr:hypothetical protein [Solirubrobacteraceae bacterium]